MNRAREMDWILFGSVVALLAFGFVICYSAGSVVGGLRGRGEWYYIGRQATFALAGVPLLLFLSRMDFRLLNRPAWAFLLMGGITIAVFAGILLDPSANRWIRLGSIQAQPSEFAKPALIVFCAYFIAKRMKAINDRHTVLPASIAVGILGGAVIVGDLGTAVVLVTTAVLLFLVAGLKWRYIVIAVALAGCFLVAAIALKPYRLFRVIGFVDPNLKIIRTLHPEWAENYEAQNRMKGRDATYQVKQSVVAVGAGGLAGAGLMEGKQKLLYLPEAHTDFIFAVIGEELGFVGTMFTLGLFLVITWRGIRIFLRTDDLFGKYLALGVTVLIIFQALMNISVVLGIAPTKGIPLPMVSYGGSSLLSSMICFGLLLSVSERTS
ncbi:MAG: FtsW/RodA/SpoVE family cell cycle protein [Bryobacterales bacterium]|nr:FtsW/RodA/SpoVE family cell cycle protein [Bryobacterales bacterium]